MANFRVAYVTTTDNTDTTIDTIAMDTNTAVFVETHIVAIQDDGSNRAGYVRRALAYREAAAADLQGPVETTTTRESSAQWDATIGVNGNDLEILVKGQAGTTIKWRSETWVSEISI